MKRIFKITIYTLISLIILIIGSILYLYNQRTEFVLTTELKERIRLHSQESNPLSEKIYNFYSLQYTNGLTNSPNRLYGLEILNKSNQSCACVELARIYINQARGLDYGLNKLIIANYLFDNYGNKRCLDLYLNRFDFVNGQIGIENASNFYFKSTISELKDKELATLIIMLRNPSLFNPIRFPDTVKIEVKSLIEKIETKPNNS